MAKFIDFKKARANDLIDYIENNAPQDKAWFKQVAFDSRKKKTAIKQVDDNGEPIMYQVKKKNGEPKLDKFGKPVFRQKVKMVETNEGDAKAVFNLLKAKRAFYARYFPDQLPVATDKDKPSDRMKDW